MSTPKRPYPTLQTHPIIQASKAATAVCRCLVEDGSESRSAGTTTTTGFRSSSPSAKQIVYLSPKRFDSLSSSLDSVTAGSPLKFPRKTKPPGGLSTSVAKKVSEPKISRMLLTSSGGISDLPPPSSSPSSNFPEFSFLTSVFSSPSSSDNPGPSFSGLSELSVLVTVSLVIPVRPAPPLLLLSERSLNGFLHEARTLCPRNPIPPVPTSTNPATFLSISLHTSTNNQRHQPAGPAKIAINNSPLRDNRSTLTKKNLTLRQIQHGNLSKLDHSPS
mmetsp:Transcript_40975/g.162219  ORF Transcript_40975/g.162219 Transcript_40975/m.162219 type:complete len:275 (+) Transcript_40975:4025-4849(+)